MKKVLFVRFYPQGHYGCMARRSVRSFGKAIARAYKQLVAYPRAMKDRTVRIGRAIRKKVRVRDERTPEIQLGAGRAYKITY